MNYEQLKVLVDGYLHRDDITASFDALMTIVEDKIRKRVRANEMVTSLDVVLTGDRYPLPDTYLDVESFYVNTNSGNKVLENITLDQLSVRDSNVLSAYAQSGNELILNVDIDIANPQTGRFTYYATPLPLFTNPITNMLTAYPNLYLSGMMVEAQLLIQDSEQLGIWLPMFDKEVAAINKHSAAAKYKLPRVRK